MYDFCPHCGQTLEQEQIAGAMLVCAYCGKDIGFVGAVGRADVDEADELIRGGTVARCPVCRQVVEAKSAGAARKFVPHYASPQSRKICPASGKPVPADPGAPAAPTSPLQIAKQLRPYMTENVLKVISCKKSAEPMIEVLMLAYLDKAERVRVQIDALREILGPNFRMNEYPANLHKPHLRVWGNADACVVAMRNDQGGYQSIADAELAAVLADLRQFKSSFFA